MKWPVILHVCWTGAAFASEGFKSGHRGRKHLGFQTLMEDAEEAVKEDTQEDEEWRASQDRRGARAKKAQAIRNNHGEESPQQKKHPGFQTLLKEAEEAEKENLEADEKWEEDDPEADEIWQSAHNLFEKLHHKHAHSETQDATRKHKEHESHFPKWAKQHSGFQHLMMDAEETESEEREAEHEAVIEKKDDAFQKAVHQDQQPMSNPEDLESRKHSEGQALGQDSELSKVAEDDNPHTQQSKDEDQSHHKQDQAKGDLGFQKLLTDEEEAESKLQNQAKIQHKRVEDGRHNELHEPGFQTLVKDAEREVQERDAERALAKTNDDLQEREIERAVEDAPVSPELKARRSSMSDKSGNSPHKAAPGFQKLLEDEERWVWERAAASEFLRHRSNQMSKGMYRPIDDMQDTGTRFRSVPLEEYGGKGTFWHSMGKFNKKLDSEEKDVLKMKEAAESEGKEGLGSQGQAHDPQDLHDTSRILGGHLTRQVGAMSSWGRTREEPADEDKPAMDMIEQMRAEYCSMRPGGVMNHKECSKWMFDACKKETSTAGWCDKYQKELTTYCTKHPDHKYCKDLKDTDGDGIFDDIDVFPEDIKEWEDSDGDGVGNNADAFDEDPEKHKPEDGAGGAGGAPAPAAAAPAVSGPAAPPAQAGDWPGSSNKKAEGNTYPEQGYNEYFRGSMAAHNDKETYVGDWQGEWPQMDETHMESVFKACKNHPHSDWCIRQYRRANPSYPKKKGFFDWLFR